MFNINKALDACGTAVEDKSGKAQAGQDTRNLKAMPRSVGKPLGKDIKYFNLFSMADIELFSKDYSSCTCVY